MARQLNVTDALNYLDDVKNCFHDQPHTYEGFLDTMREFKNEQISIDDVIKRICKLFYAHPSLVQDFRTFLPDGYRIDYPRAGAGTDYVAVTTPNGGTTMYRFGDGV